MFFPPTHPPLSALLQVSFFEYLETLAAIAKQTVVRVRDGQAKVQAARTAAAAKRKEAEELAAALAAEREAEEAEGGDGADGTPPTDAAAARPDGPAAEPAEEQEQKRTAAQAPPQGQQQPDGAPQRIPSPSSPISPRSPMGSARTRQRQSLSAGSAAGIRPTSATLANKRLSRTESASSIGGQPLSPRLVSSAGGRPQSGARRPSDADFSVGRRESHSRGTSPRRISSAKSVGAAALQATPEDGHDAMPERGSTSARVALAEKARDEAERALRRAIAAQPRAPQFYADGSSTETFARLLAL